jgi:hypothetical protein
MKPLESLKPRKPMKTDKGQFDEVLRRMIQKNPQKTATIKKSKHRKKNPHEGPMEPPEMAERPASDSHKQEA